MSPPLSWHLKSFFVPERLDASVVERLEWCRAFRARILCDGNRRPEFRSGDGSFADVQELDFNAWHFTARKPGGPVLGYIRLATPAALMHHQTRLFLGPDRFTAFLDGEDVRDGGVFEPSRIVVDEAARGLGLGAYLFAVSMAAARVLGASAMVATSGTADGQLQLWQRFGFRIVPGSRAYIERYTEDVVAIVNRTQDTAAEFEGLVSRIAARPDLLLPVPQMK
ncbi:hypothetical protein [Streptomyces sp. NPDC057909]|uniref:hypothetical protein n=1 Tax=Streptomyces sp. NPDC057909 TaxID=3346277 RepID=UPI0036E09606